MIFMILEGQQSCCIISSLRSCIDPRSYHETRTKKRTQLIVRLSKELYIEVYISVEEKRGDYFALSQSP